MPPCTCIGSEKEPNELSAKLESAEFTTRLATTISTISLCSIGKEERQSSGRQVVWTVQSDAPAAKALLSPGFVFHSSYIQRAVPVRFVENAAHAIVSHAGHVTSVNLKQKRWGFRHAPRPLRSRVLFFLAKFLGTTPAAEYLRAGGRHTWRLLALS